MNFYLKNLFILYKKFGTCNYFKNEKLLNYGSTTQKLEEIYYGYSFTLYKFLIAIETLITLISLLLEKKILIYKITKCFCISSCTNIVFQIYNV